MDDELIVTIHDARKAGYCVSGVRRWAAVQGLDFRAFLKDGIAASRLLDTGDAIAAAIVARTQEARHGSGG